MSEISKALTRYLKTSNTNVYQISQNSDLDRTMMQKMVKGTKLPSLKFFTKFCDYLILNEDERKELIRQFKIEKIGADKYNTRLAVQNLLVHFQEARTLYAHSRADLTFKFKDQPELLTLSSDSMVRSAIFYLIDLEMEKQHPHFSFDYFKDLSSGIEKIAALRNEFHKDVKLDEYIHLARHLQNQEGALANIRLLRSVLPIAFTFGNDYHVYYNYMNITSKDSGYLMFPHYFVTSDGVCMISGDGKRGVMQVNPTIAEKFHCEMDNIRAHSYNLFTNYFTIDEGVEQYAGIQQNNISLIFSTTPTESLMLRDIIDEMPEELRKVYKRISIHLENQLNSDFKWIFSLDRMDAFFRDGILPDHYANYMDSLTKRQRRLAAESFIAGLKEYPCFYLVKDARLFSGADVDVRLIAPQTINVYSTQVNMPYGMLNIEEGSLYNTFMDYFNALIEDGSVYDPKETVEQTSQLFDQMMKRYGI